MKEGRCLKNDLGWTTITKVDECSSRGKTRQADLNSKGMDMRVCSCKGDLCNKLENWKPDSFEEVKPVKGGGLDSNKEKVGNASQRLQIWTAGWSSRTIGIVFFTLPI